MFQVRDDDNPVAGRRMACKRVVEKKIKCSSLGHVKSEMFVRHSDGDIQSEVMQLLKLEKLEVQVQHIAEEHQHIDNL